MKSILFQELVKPMIHRLGTVIGVYLASADLFTQAQIDILTQGGVIIAGLAVDLLVRKVL